MSDFVLLILEDDNSQINTFLRFIENINNINVRKIKSKICYTLNEAIEYLENETPDGAIIDLHLQETNGEIKEGKVAIKKLYNDKICPISIVSGFLGDLVNEDFPTENNLFFRKYDKTSDYSVILKEFLEYDLIVETYKRIIKKNSELLNKIFWDHLSHTSIFKKDIINSNEIDEVLLRYVTNHLYGYLEIKSRKNDNKYYSFETYIIPPIEEAWFPGNIIKCNENNCYYVTMNPLCAIEQDKFENKLLLLSTLPIEDHPKLKNKQKGSKEYKEKLKDIIKNKDDCFHYLPRYENIPTCLIDFRNLKTVEKNADFKNQFEQIASITKDFFKDIRERFHNIIQIREAPIIIVMIISRKFAMKILLMKLSKWFNKNQRSFPWRNYTNPYKIMIAEFMLHRTKAEQVVPVYEKFIKKYPDVFSLANGKAKNITNVTQHLGLHWRNKHFIKAAQYLVNNYNGAFPKSREELLNIPGVGDYVAGAILTVCFNKQEYVVDSNIARFINRFYGLNLEGEIRRKKHIIEKAKELFNIEYPGKFLFMILDFTSALCKPRNPLCDICPLYKKCIYNCNLKKIEIILNKL